MFFVTGHPNFPPITRWSDKCYPSTQYGLSSAADLLKLSNLTYKKPATMRLRVTRGANGTRTRNPLLAKQVRYQLRHSPVGVLVLHGVRHGRPQISVIGKINKNLSDGDADGHDGSDSHATGDPFLHDDPPLSLACGWWA